MTTHCLRAGSILFTLSCSTGLFQIMASHSLRTRLCVAYPYAAGSLLYTWGAHCTMVASADALKQLKKCDAPAQAQAATLRQSAQLMPAVQLSKASTRGKSLCGTPAGCAPFARHASSSNADSQCSQLSDGCNALQEEGLTLAHMASSDQKTHEQPPMLFVDSRNGTLHQHFTLKFNLISARRWAVLDLTGESLFIVGIYEESLESLDSLNLSCAP